MLLHHPVGVLRLGLRQRARAVVHLRGGVVAGGRGAFGDEVLRVVPDGGEVAIEVDADGVGVARDGVGGVAVLAPAEVGGVVVGDAVGVEEGEEDDADREGDADVRGGVGHAAVGEAGVRAVGVEEVRGEVEEVVGAAALAGVDAGGDEDGVGGVGGVGGPAELEAGDGSLLVGFVGGVEAGEVELAAEGLGGGVDFGNVVHG